jgi:predicted N-acetyltransferase YhbS
VCTMIAIRQEKLSDIDAREALLDQAFGEARFRKSSERLREDRLPAQGLAFVAAEGRRVIGTARLWHVACGAETPALLLGPVAVAADCRGRGTGAALVRRAVEAARKLGHAAIVLVGDAVYSSLFGLFTEKTGALWMPGPFERQRLLALELIPGALDGAHGLIGAAGELAPKPDLASLVAHDRRHRARASPSHPRGVKNFRVAEIAPHPARPRESGDPGPEFAGPAAMALDSRLRGNERSLGGGQPL